MNLSILESSSIIYSHIHHSSLIATRCYEIYNIDDVAEYDSTVFWSHFDWAKEMDYEEGVYYVTGTRTADQSYERVLLEKEEWLEQFGEDIGVVVNLFLQLCNQRVTCL